MEQLQQGFTDSMQKAGNEEIKKSAKSLISVLIYFYPKVKLALKEFTFLPNAKE